MEEELTPEELRKTSLLGSTVMQKILAGAYKGDLVDQHSFTTTDVVDAFAALAPHMTGPVTEPSIWCKELGDLFVEGAFAPRSRYADLERVRDAIVDWAIRKPDWLQNGTDGSVVIEIDPRRRDDDLDRKAA
jgi:hypothetical protein